MPKLLLATFALILAATATGSAKGTPQDHHCKLTDGSFDGTKTKKECATAKGTWEKDAELTGAVKTGVVAIGGETTGIELTTADGKTVELDLHGDKDLVQAASALDGKQATVTGYLTVKPGVEIKQRHIFLVSTIAAKK